MSKETNAVPQFQLFVTATDKQNLVKLLNRIQTTGLEEAQMLIGYAKLIQEAPPVEETPKEPEE